MPDLPTVTVTTTQMNRLIAAFPGATNAEKADAYRAWLKDRLRDYVIRVETRAMDEQHNTAKRSAVQEAETALP